MRCLAGVTALVFLGVSSVLMAQTKLSPHWEELTGPDFIEAIHQADGVCMLPFGIMEKHGEFYEESAHPLDTKQ
jgi:creatinine amidohydrolase